MELAGGWPAEAADRRGTSFVATIVSNQARFYSLFEAIFVLVVNKERFATAASRTENDYGKSGRASRDPELPSGLERELLSAPGAVAIDDEATGRGGR
jgi:hypothetical protein